MVPTKNKPLKYFQETLQSCLEGSRGSNRAEIQNWLENSKLISRAHKSLKEDQKVSTIMNRDQPKFVQRIFYKSTIEDILKKEVDLADLISRGSKSILLRGRLGLGKSILLKYLCFLELNLGRSIPVFIELRHVSSPDLIFEAASDKLCEIGLEASTKLVKSLYSKGKITLFLDGFDEIGISERKEFNEAISKLVTLSQSTRLLVTSRHYTEVNRNVRLKIYTISLLKSSELLPLVEKILQEHPKELLSIKGKISKSQDFDYEILDTPLLVTWFIMVYRMKRKIPRHKIGFYKELFDTIMSRHDGLKGSYDRPSKSGLADDEIKTVLDCFCYLTRKDQDSIFSEQEVNFYIRRSLNTCGFSDINTNEYLYDLTNVTCLLARDNAEYTFIHNSVQYYFSACFVCSAIEKSSKTFYEKRIEDWRYWEEELKFLEILDEYRFISYFFEPCLEKVLSDKDVLRTDVADEILGKTDIVYFKQGSEIKFLFCMKARSDFFAMRLFEDLQDESDFKEEAFASVYVQNVLLKKLTQKRAIEICSRDLEKFVFIPLEQALREVKLLGEFKQKWNAYAKPVLLSEKEKLIKRKKMLEDRIELF